MGLGFILNFNLILFPVWDYVMIIIGLIPGYSKYVIMIFVIRVRICRDIERMFDFYKRKLMVLFVQEELIKKHHGISYQSLLFRFSRENLAF